MKNTKASNSDFVALDLQISPNQEEINQILRPEYSITTNEPRSNVAVIYMQAKEDKRTRGTNFVIGSAIGITTASIATLAVLAAYYIFRKM